MNLKQEFDNQRQELKNEIKKAINNFQNKTGCQIIKIEVNTYKHQKLSVNIAIETTIENDNQEFLDNIL